jgi:restriction endonuclease S subunit
MNTNNIDKSNWRKVSFGDVAIQQKEAIDVAVTQLNRYIAGEHMTSDDLHIRQWGTVGDGYLGPAFIRKFKKGDILYGSRRTYLKKVAVADFDGITSNTTFVIKANTKNIIPELLPFIMLSDGFTEHSIKHSKGSVNPYINWKDIANYEFLLPPKDQQAHLAELLWAADEVMERNLEALTHLEDCKKSYLLNKCEDKNQLLISFSDLVEINPSIEMPADKNVLVSFISMADVSNEGLLINKEDRPLKEVAKNGFTPFCENDILFAKITPCMENGKGTIAKGLTNGLGLGSTEFHILRPKKKSDLQFCFYLSRMETFRKKAERLMTGSAGQKRVQPEFFDYYKFHAPNPQRRMIIGETLDNIEKEINFVRAHISNSQQLKSALINQIF